jgi:protocatechuate 3,4-dioxygenase beta subunit
MTLTVLDRRSLLKALTLAPAALALPQALRAEAQAAGLISTDVCMVQKEVTEGPFYLDPHLMRQDITEGRPGLPMVLRLQVVRADCAPIAGARVDVWHCDAGGLYSGVGNMGAADTTGETFLRGSQMTGADGVAEFRSIFPGWYRGRAVHVHYKVWLDETNALTGQVFFDDTLSDTIYAEHDAYEGRGARDRLNASDRIAQEAGPAAVARLELDAPDGEAVAALVIGLDEGARSGTLLERLFGQA